MSYKLQQLAEYLDAELCGDGEVIISSVAPIESATAGAISFVSDKKYLQHLRDCAATAVIVTPQMQEEALVPTLVVANPRAAYARLVSLLYPQYTPSAGVHATAVIAENATIDPSASIGANVVIEDGAIIAADVKIDAGCVVGRNSSIGQGTHLYPNVTVYHNCKLGEYCIMHSSAVIGSDGFGFEYDQGSWLKIPQVGGVIIGNHVEIGACSVVDRGALNDTVVADGVKLDNHVQIAHNVQVGEHTIMSRGVGIAGSTKIGKNCIFGGMTGVKDHVELADNVIVTAMSMVTKSLHKAGSYSSNTPIDDTASWRKNSARFRQLDEMARKIRQLEKHIKDKG